MMKSIQKQILLCALGILCTFNATSQNFEGIGYKTVLSEAFLCNQFGNDYSLTSVSFDGGLTTYDAYAYGRDTIVVDKLGRLKNAILNTTRFAIDITDKSDGIRVGQKFDSLRIMNTYDKDVSIHIDDWQDKNKIFIGDELHPDRLLIVENGLVKMIRGGITYSGDLDGIAIGELVSQELIIQKFGKPDSVFVDETPGYEAILYYYVDGDQTSILEFSKSLRLYDYRIRSPKFRMFTDTIDGGIRVGDCVEKASLMFSSDGYCEKYYCDGGGEYEGPVLTIENGIIKEIYFRYMNP